jgi:hypothetical protein
MSAPAAPVSAERFDFRSVMVGGTKLGLLIGLAVVLFLAVSRFLPGGLVRLVAQALVVLVAGGAAAFLPGLWVAPRSGEGIAGVAALGLWGTVVFSAFDIVLLRPFDAYPWTWDAIGGNSTWWYLPLWWMLGTFVAWMGGIIAARTADSPPGLVRLALPTVAGAFGIGIAVSVAGVALPVATGGGLVVVLTARALVALARSR